ncbi:MAG: hypothetical protein DMF93_15845 [Acidobacteria bacterium]|nr:MAG: hypothetical protein DMF93_15845 [Acidobacteriota bacterium]
MPVTSLAPIAAQTIIDPAAGGPLGEVGLPPRLQPIHVDRIAATHAIRRIGEGVASCKKARSKRVIL